MTVVLIVDDNESNRKLARDLLRSAGAETLESATDRCEDVANIIEGVVLENS